MSDAYRILILPRASGDLIEICTYIEQDSPQNAASVAQRLLTAVDSLDRFPHRYELHEHRNDPAKAVRSMSVAPFIVYYRIDDAQRTVRILSVRHGARRQPKRFK